MAVNQIDYKDYVFQFYESNDEALIPTFEVDTFLTSSSCIELIIYDNTKTPLYSTYNFNNYNLDSNSQSPGTDPLISQFNINPEEDTIAAGFDVGEYVAYYNFLTKRIGDNFSTLFIKEISSDRTEILLDSTSLSNLDIIEQTNNFIEFRENSTYFVDFYLNFGDNQLVIANNIKIQNETTNNPQILVKLYEPLPPQFNLKAQSWIVTQLNEPEAFQISYPVEPVFIIDSTPLQGPNFNIPIKGQVNNSSQNLSENDILLGAPTSSLDHVESLLNEKSINISVDYTDFSDFIHFSSGKTRLENFYYKASLIEGYSASIFDLFTTTSSATSTLILQNKISEIIKNFDGYDRFLYYTSGSDQTWPKTTTEPPYLLAKTGSAAVVNWLGSDNEVSAYYGGMILSASNYDNENNNQLLKSIPEYLREDAANQQYELFVDMVAQYYDNVWLYTKDVTQKYNADNRLDFGISKDLVADAIKDFGLKLYQNNFSNSELYTAFLGLTPSGSLFPFPNITGSTPVPSGYELVDTMISASNDVISMDDTNKSLYKRIYHNIPYLLNTKGTIPGLRALITSYGIPDTILKISEFGGKDKVNENDWDYYFNKFNYAWKADGTNYIRTPWPINADFNSPNNKPSTLELRFKAEKFPPTNLSQSIFSLYNAGGNLTSDLILEYSGSGFDSGSIVNTSGSYSGSIKDPYYQYANLKWIPDVTAGDSASVYLPFFDEGWWSVMITSGSSNGYDLYAANKIYNGNDGTSIGYFSSSSVTQTFWNSGFLAYYATSSTHEAFSGSLQEIRYYTTILSESVFKDYTMNPLSIEGNGINSSPNQLIFRAALGSELDITTTSSIHPKVTGSWTTTSSFSSDSNYTFGSTPSYNPNTEYYFLDQFPAGIKNRITDKIRYEDSTIPSGNVLSPIRSLSQTVEASASYTDSINYLEVAFSPQNQINDDIISQIGYFNIGDYIGDPRQRSSSAQIYPDLNALSEEYFEKYIKNYDLTDFVRLIKFFDNSLFKMIKDFIPVRTSLASGLVVKQHLLERNKYPQPQVSYENKIHTGSIDMVAISGGAGGVFNVFNGLNTSPYGVDGNGPDNRYDITQSWSETFTNLSGSVSKLHDNQDEFYDGEFSGSVILVTNGELNEECNGVKNIQVLPKVEYNVRLYGLSYGVGGFGEVPWYSAPGDNAYDIDTFLSNKNIPLQGNISVTKMKSGSVFPNSENQYYNQIPSTECEFIKISNFDKNGIDISNATTNLSHITIVYNSSPLTYNILKLISITSNYTLYQVTRPSSYPEPTSSSLHTIEIDMTGSLENKGEFFSPGGGVFTEATYAPITSINTNPYNFYNSTTGEININTYTQNPSSSLAAGPASYDIEVSGSITVTGGSELYAGIYPNQSNTPIEITPSGSPTGNFSLKVSNYDSQFPVTTGYRFGIYTTDAFPLTASLDLTFSLVKIEPYLSSSYSASVGLEPFTLTKFQNTDCDVLLGEVENARSNPYLQDLDYDTSQTVPVNYSVVLTDNATRATVPESYYTSPSQINNRYVGSKNQSSDFNIYNPLARGTDFGDPINIGTFGQTPSVESLDTTIYEFNWGGGTTPEILGWGAVKMGKLLQVNSTSSVRTINPSEGLKEILIPNSIQSSLYSLSSEWGRSASLSQSVSDYYYKLNSNNPLNHEISMNLYGSSTPGSSPTLPSTTRILTTEYGVPTKSTFVVTSSAHGSSTYGSGYLSTIEYNGVSSYPFLNSGVPTTASYIRFFDNKSINLINKDYEVGMAFPPQSLLITGSYPVSTYVTASFTPLAEQLNNGERYFATFYLDLEEGFDSSNLVPLHYNTSPLGQKGVVEIVGIAQSSGTSGTPFDTYLLLKDNMDMNAVISQGAFYTGSWDTGVTKSLSCRIGAGDLGCFIWKARAAGDNEFVMVQDSITGGVSAGAFTSKYATQEITDNFEDITKTYGSNKQ